MKELIRSIYQCKECGDIIESKHRHDFTTCQCGNLSIDGGLDYTRIIYDKENSWIDLSEYKEEENESKEK
jgi:predicted class III extradiol MEMO1 family dioxygenase